MNANLSIIGMYNYRPDIFEYLSLPDGISAELQIDQILLKAGELELLYQSADFMKEAIRIWSTTEQSVWMKMYATTTLDYNPIWNKDGTITTTNKGNYTDDSTGISSVKGFNSNAWAEHAKIDSDRKGTTTGEEIRRETGNIGVTTTQQMIREERDISEFNMYDYIADSFIDRFCLMVY